MQQAAHKEPARHPEVIATVTRDGARTVQLLGAWDVRALESDARTLQAALQDAARVSEARWDLSQVQRFDHIGALLVWRAWGRCRPNDLLLRREDEVFFGDCETAGAAGRSTQRFDPLAPVIALGTIALTVLRHALQIIQLFGQLLIDALTVIRQPLLRPRREFFAGIYRIGAQALGITAMVGFLIGVVLSYLSAEQLRLYGADTFIINILGVGITHSLRLILPKMAAIAVALPLLVLWTSAVALLGGAVSAKLELGMSIVQFFAGLPAAVPGVNLWLGVGKGVVFGLLIALIACHFGLRIQPNTESLAAGTTRSVVTSITAVIIADAIFAVIF